MTGGGGSCGGGHSGQEGTSPSADEAARTSVEDVAADDVAAGTAEHGPGPRTRPRDGRAGSPPLRGPSSPSAAMGDVVADVAAVGQGREDASAAATEEATGQRWGVSSFAAVDVAVSMVVTVSLAL